MNENAKKSERPTHMPSSARRRLSSGGRWLSLAANDRLRDAARGLALAQKDLADRLGISEPALSQWLSGRHGLGPDKAAALCDLVGICLSDLEAPPNTVGALETAIAYEGAASAARWPASVVAHCRSGAVPGGGHLTPRQWTDMLDQLTAFARYSDEV